MLLQRGERGQSLDGCIDWKLTNLLELELGLSIAKIFPLLFNLSIFQEFSRWKNYCHNMIHQTNALAEYKKRTNRIECFAEVDSVSWLSFILLFLLIQILHEHVKGGRRAYIRWNNRFYFVLLCINALFALKINRYWYTVCPPPPREKGHNYYVIT